MKIEVSFSKDFQEEIILGSLICAMRVLQLLSIERQKKNKKPRANWAFCQPLMLKNCSQTSRKKISNRILYIFSKEFGYDSLFKNYQF